MEQEKIICDTDVMIDYWDAKNKRHSATLKLLDDKIGLSNVVLSAITKMELLSGATNKKDLARIGKQLTRFNISLINDRITLTSLSLIQKYSLSHRLSYLIVLLLPQRSLRGYNFLLIILKTINLFPDLLYTEQFPFNIFICRK